jgi:hypothetical protein
MRFEPKSKEELTKLLPEGKYSACVRSAEEATSKTSGAPMLVLKVEIYDQEGRCFVITDRIVFTEAMQWKLLAFCESADLMEQYNAGELSPLDCEGKSVSCKVVRKTDDYGSKNEIKSYFVPKDAKPKANPPESKAPTPNRKAATPINEDSDVPF